MTSLDHEIEPWVEGDWHVDIIVDVLLQYQAPRTYIEIGVRTGTCFNAVLPHANCHGVDINGAYESHLVGGSFYHMASDDFFSTYSGDKAHAIFIDGEHTYEQAKTDFYNALKIIREDGTIVLHDTWPVIKENENMCGTVWRLAKELSEELHHNTYTYRKFPGLTLVQLKTPTF